MKSWPKAQHATRILHVSRDSLRVRHQGQPEKDREQGNLFLATRGAKVGLGVGDISVRDMDGKQRNRRKVAYPCGKAYKPPLRVDAASLRRALACLQTGKAHTRHGTRRRWIGSLSRMRRRSPRRHRPAKYIREQETTARLLVVVHHLLIVVDCPRGRAGGLASPLLTRCVLGQNGNVLDSWVGAARARGADGEDGVHVQQPATSAAKSSASLSIQGSLCNDSARARRLS